MSSLTNGFSNPLVCWNFFEASAKRVLKRKRCLRLPSVSAGKDKGHQEGSNNEMSSRAERNC